MIKIQSVNLSWTHVTKQSKLKEKQRKGVQRRFFSVTYKAVTGVALNTITEDIGEGKEIELENTVFRTAAC